MFTTIESERSAEPQSADNAATPNILLQGSAIARRHWPFIVWGYAINLVFALLASAPFSSGLAPLLDHSLAAQRISGTLELGTFGELLFHLRDAHFAPMVFSVARLHLLELLILVVLFAATDYVYLTGEAALSGVARAGTAYFWRFLRGSLLAGCIAGGILGVLLGGRSTLLALLAQGSSGRTMFLYAAFSGGVVFLLGALVRLWFDLVELYIARHTLAGEPRVRRALVPAFRLLFRHFVRLFGGFLLIGFIATSALALCLLLWKALPANMVWLAFLLGQTGLFLLLAGRFWQRGLEAALLLAADPPLSTLAETEPATEDEPLPSFIGVAGLSGLAEPTLSELVQKLRTEPWRQPALPPPPEIAPVEPSPDPVSKPGSTADSLGAEQIANSPLDLHASKFPLGGAAAPATPESQAPPVEKPPA